MLSLNREDYSLKLTQTDRGILVEQVEERYIARDWYLTPQVETFVDICLRNGLTCAIRQNHPQKNLRLPSGGTDFTKSKGANFIGFSRQPSERWVVVIDEWCPKAKKSNDVIQRVLFNRNFRAVLENTEVRSEVMSSNIAHVFVPFDQAESAVRACAPHVEAVESTLGTRKWEKTKAEIGFINEAILEQWMVENWAQLDFGTNLDFVGQQVDRMDVVARHSSGAFVVFELKRATADQGVIDQVTRYVNGPARNHANGKPIWAAIVAERFRQDLHAAVEALDFPLCLFRFEDTASLFRIRRVKSNWPDHIEM